MHPLIQYFEGNSPVVYGTAYATVVLIMIITVFYKVSKIKAEAKLKVQIMSETIDELIQDHDEELMFEKKIAAAHVIKMRMQKRDFNSKLGGLQRKLRKQNETLNTMNSKLVSLEFVEEDANELVDEVVAVREKLREKDEIIEALRKQLKFYEMNCSGAGTVVQRVLQVSGKENSLL